MENETTMTSEQSPQSGLINTNRIIAPAGLGKRLRASRESLRLSEKEAAARLRLNPRIIPIMENEDFDNDLPPTFMRGYLRSYMRMLNLPEEEINITVTRIEATLPQQAQPATPTPSILTARPRHHSYRYLRWMTYVVAAVLAVLVSTWWSSHSKDTIVKAPDSSTPASAPAEAQAPVTPAPTPDQPAAASTTAPVIPALPMVEKPTPPPSANSAATDDSDDDTQTTDGNNTTDQKDQISAALDAASTEANATTNTATASADNAAASTNANSSETDATTTESTPKHHARSEESNQDKVYNDY